MSDLPLERDKGGRFVKAPEATSPDLEQEYHPIALRLFGWTRSSRVSLVAILALVTLLVITVALTAGGQGVSGSLMASTGVYAGLGLIGAILIATIGAVAVRFLGRDADYYGEDDTLPDDVEELI